MTGFKAACASGDLTELLADGAIVRVAIIIICRGRTG